MTVLIADPLATFDSLGVTAGYTGTATPTNTNTQGGGPGVRINSTGGVVRIRGLDATGAPTAEMGATSLYVSVWVYIAARPTGFVNHVMLYNSAGAQRVGVAFTDSTGTLNLRYSNGSDVNTSIGVTAVIPLGLHLIEVKCQNVSSVGGASAELKVDGVSLLSASGLTIGSGSRTIDRLGLEMASSGDVTFSCPVADDAAYPGPCATQVLVPSASGNANDWVTGTGATFAEVDEVDGSHANDGDTTYSKDSTNGHIQLFNTTNTTGTLGTIKAVVPWIICRDEGGASAIAVAHFRTSQATTYYTSDSDPGATYAYRARIRSLDPDTSAAWTQANVDLLQVGMANSASVAARVTAVGIFVIYQPVVLGVAALTASATIGATAQAIHAALAALTAAATISPAAKLTLGGAAALAASATLSPAPVATYAAASALAASAVLSPAATVTTPTATAALTAAASLAAVASLTLPGAASLSATATLAGVPALTLQGVAALAASAQVAAAPRLTLSGAAALLAAAAIHAAATRAGIVGWRRPQVGDARTVTLAVGDADPLASVTLPPGDAAPIGTLPPGDA